MQVGDLVRYKQPEGDTGLLGIVIRTSDRTDAIQIEWNDGERHIYFAEHQSQLEVVCK